MIEGCISVPIVLEHPLKFATHTNNNYLEAVAIGNIYINSVTTNSFMKCKIENVFYRPNLRKNRSLEKKCFLVV